MGGATTSSSCCTEISSPSCSTTSCSSPGGGRGGNGGVRGLSDRGGRVAVADGGGGRGGVRGEICPRGAAGLLPTSSLGVSGEISPPLGAGESVWALGTSGPLSPEQKKQEQCVRNVGKQWPKCRVLYTRRDFYINITFFVWIVASSVGQWHLVADKHGHAEIHRRIEPRYIEISL